MSIPVEIPADLLTRTGTVYPPGPSKKFFGLNILIPYYTRYLDFISKIKSRYGNIAYFDAGGEKIFLINDPGFIEHILITNPDNYLRGTGFSRLRMLLGDGLLSTDGAIHKRHRTMIQPSFHKTSVDSYFNLISASSDNIINEWKSTSTLEIQEKSVELFLKIICDLLFGEGKCKDLIKIIKYFDSLTYDYKALMLIGLPGLSNKLPLSWVRKYFALRKEIDPIVYSFIEEKKNDKKDSPDILSMLLNAKDTSGAGLSDKEIRDELVTILFASYDTSARTLTWAMYLLSKNPTVLQTLLSFNDAKEQSEFADMIISETLRIYPPAHSMTRVTAKEDSYEQYTIPAGCSIIITPYLLHRDKQNFARPMEFLPERWSAENRRKINRHTYLPFGAGKRSCMGEVFARMQVNIALQKICKEFEFSFEGDAKETSILTLKPNRGIMLNLKHKKHG